MKGELDDMTWDYYNTEEDKIEKSYDVGYAVEGTPLELYASLAMLASLGITLTFTDEDFIAGRKAFMEKIKRMVESARKKFKKRKGD